MTLEFSCCLEEELLNYKVVVDKLVLIALSEDMSMSILKRLIKG